MSETSSLWHGNTFHFKQIYLFLKNYLHVKWLQSFGLMFFRVGICLINNTFLIHCFKVQIPIWLNDSVWGLCNQNESMHYRKCSFLINLKEVTVILSIWRQISKFISIISQHWVLKRNQICFHWPGIELFPNPQNHGLDVVFTSTSVLYIHGLCMDQQTRLLINSFDFLQPILDVDCDQWECSIFVAVNLWALRNKFPWV